MAARALAGNASTQAPFPREMARRDFLFQCGTGLGSLALSYLLDHEGLIAEEIPGNPLAQKPPHFSTKAKACIFLFMGGGPGQMDTFDPKPALTRFHGTLANDSSQSAAEGSRLLYVGSPFQFSRHGKSGIEVSEIFPKLAACVDDMAIVRSLYTDSDNHSAGALLMNIGRPLPGSPSLGSWMVYGLGTESQNLPAFVVFPEVRGANGIGPLNWSNGYLPGIYQGTLLNPTGPAIVDLQPPQGVSSQQQESTIRLLNKWNRDHLESNPIKGDLLARIKNYELAFRMQTAVPEALDIQRESRAIQELYGLNDAITEPMGRKCLMARRLVERGVRFVQIFNNGWDSHFDLTREHRKRGAETDGPIAGLLKDLKQRGLLSQTLVVWGGEFGRTVESGRGIVPETMGREHNKEAMVMWFAGGGVKGGTVVGATDELGKRAAENRYHIHDLHATLLHLMGLDDMRLTYYHAGRFKRLTDLGGRLIKEMMV
ncbi:MAG: DUF1501 domain-containing protein [Acidobacteria bacterium]|nr:DUF1501 domain-containing protein [Acidobacteriota bacterium]